MSNRESAPPTLDKRQIIEKVVLVFVIGYGLHYFGYFLRVRYFNMFDALTLDEGLVHALMYLGHLFFLGSMAIYAWAVERDRKYFLAPFKEGAARNLKFAVLGVLFGAVLMGTCILAASLHGDIVVHGATGASIPILLLAVFCVFVQASIEEVESRGFVFGKMIGEGVPLVPAVLVSSMFFSWLHGSNPGFGVLPFVNIVFAGVLYTLCYYYFGNLWFTMTAHFAWNYMQDFIFGLPDSGKPAAISFLNTTVENSSFFYDANFGIEGSGMSTLVHIAAIIAVILIGRRVKAKKASS